MSIVLIIIGVILGAVIKGKDLIRSAEQKKIYNTFVQEWQIVYQNYFDRTGFILGDVDNADNGVTGGGRDGVIDAAPANILLQLQQIGLDSPPPGPSGSAFQRSYTDNNGQQRNIILTLNSNSAWGNHIELTAQIGAGAQTGLPHDLGMALDTIIDGSADGTSGELQLDTNRNNAAQNAVAWPSAQNAPGGNDGAIISLPF